MCGIAGIIELGDTEKFLGYIQEMNNSQRHRGPDDEGFSFFERGRGQIWTYGGADTPETTYQYDLAYAPKAQFPGQPPAKAAVAFAHRRLSVIDLTGKGHQPMCTQDKRYWIVYNGEIYNYLELREELKKLGYRFYSESDTEVLLNAYGHWGKGALNRLTGMFALAVYDREQEELFLARDFFGIKPLYYAMLPGAFVFASEIKALLTIPQVGRRANPERLHEFLYSGLTDYGEETMLAEVKQVPPAHYLSFRTANPRKIDVARYYDIDITQEKDLSVGEAASNLRELFLQNLRLHMRSDVTVGAALSGGIDSSSIVMGMRHLQDKGLDLHAFTYIAEDPRLCEEKWADMVGVAASARVHKVWITEEDLLSDLDHLICVQDEPFGSTTIYAQYRVMRLAKERGIKVMLDGQGGDEFLAGYRSYWGARLASLIRQLYLAKAIRFFFNTLKHGYSQWAILLMQGGRAFLPAPLHAPLMRIFRVDRVSSWLEGKWFRERGVEPRTYKGTGSRFFMREELYKLMTAGELYTLLRYEDRNSMAHSVESRVPFLTPELTTFVCSLPEDFLIDGEGTSKSVFRLAMHGIVPDDILSRKDKIGFATPELKWLISLLPWVEKTLAGDTANNMQPIDINRFRADWESVVSGKGHFDWRFWRVINLIKWIEQNGISLN